MSYLDWNIVFYSINAEIGHKKMLSARSALRKFDP